MDLSRLDRLKKLLQDDFEALPDLHLEPVSDDEDADGGVPISAKDPLPEPQNKPVADNVVQQSRKADIATADSHTKLTDPDEQSEPVSLSAGAEDAALNVRLKKLDLGQHRPQAVNELPPPPTQRGVLAPAGLTFCPILPISKFPYKFVSKADSERIADQFFNAGKFWEREWDLFYVWPPGFGAKPLILVTEAQVQALLHAINSWFQDMDVRLTDYHRESGLVIKFPDHPTLRPRFLGRSSSKDEYTKMEKTTPPATSTAPGEVQVPPPEQRTLEAFKKMIEDAVELNKAKSRLSRTKKKEERAVKQQNMGKQLKRAQRYLGLRPKREPIFDPLKDSSLDRAGLQKAQAARNEALRIPPIDPEQRPPYPFDSSVVFIAVDVEAYERNQNQITEIGISTLDVNDLAGVPPGNDGKDWLSKIRSRHFRITENSHIRNHEFVNGCPERFEFGTSEFITLQDAPAVIASSFRPPYSGPPNGTKEDLAAKRNIILVGHDTSMDINYLQKLGYNPLNLSNMLEVLDTAALYRAWKHDVQPRALGRILYDFDMPAWNLHNAGNDAFYTIQALLAIAVREASMRGSPELAEDRAATLAEKLKDAGQEAIQRAMDDADGWASNEEDDGGDPAKYEAMDEKNAKGDKASARKGKQLRTLCPYNPCTNASCRYTHTEGQHQPGPGTLSDDSRPDLIGSQKRKASGPVSQPGPGGFSLPFYGPAPPELPPW